MTYVTYMYLILTYMATGQCRQRYLSLLRIYCQIANIKVLVCFYANYINISIITALAFLAGKVRCYKNTTSYNKVKNVNIARLGYLLLLGETARASHYYWLLAMG